MVWMRPLLLNLLTSLRRVECTPRGVIGPANIFFVQILTDGARTLIESNRYDSDTTIKAGSSSSGHRTSTAYKAPSSNFNPPSPASTSQYFCFVHRNIHRRSAARMADQQKEPVQQTEPVQQKDPNRGKHCLFVLRRVLFKL